MGDQEPGLGAGDGSLEVLGETAVASEPGKGAFDNPAFGLGLECADLLGAVTKSSTSAPIESEHVRNTVGIKFNKRRCEPDRSQS